MRSPPETPPQPLPKEGLGREKSGERGGAGRASLWLLLACALAACGGPGAAATGGAGTGAGAGAGAGTGTGTGGGPVIAACDQGVVAASCKPYGVDLAPGAIGADAALHLVANVFDVP